MKSRGLALPHGRSRSAAPFGRGEKTPRARGGSQWRLASSCWSWRRLTRPRRKAPNVSALTARARARRRYDCTPERPPGTSPGMACTWLPVPDHLPEPELRLWHGKRVQQPTRCGCTPHDYLSFCCPLHHPTGSFNFEADFQHIR
eukprot:scaffold18667_cov119-Isochrysis_galbana.AAC.2